MLPYHFNMFTNLVAVIAGKKDAYQVGYVFGQLISFILILSVIVLLFLYGVRWTRKKSSQA